MYSKFHKIAVRMQVAQLFVSQYYRFDIRSLEVGQRSQLLKREYLG